MKRQLQNIMLAWALLLCMVTEVCSQLCQGPCYCPRTLPRCPPGRPLVMDGCRCCQICARQQGESCNERYLCDQRRGLHCDYSASFPGAPGVCVSQEDSNCELNGVHYKEGQVFQPSCKFQCRCSDGGITCVPLCSEDVRLPTPDCPNPQRRVQPGKCCQEWICEKMDNSLFHDAMAAYRPDAASGVDTQSQGLYPPYKCIEQSSEWSACSNTCGMGVSTRVSNRNRACRLETQSRLCIIRPCQDRSRNTPAGAKRCERSLRAARPVRFEYQGCLSAKAFQPKYCGTCADSRCCTPYQTTTSTVEFQCPRGRTVQHLMMFIDSCVCHNNCPQAYATG
ncbi:CCN family member 2-like [Polyodon spathula]|uniref:CCN family member 2-like n=1 Tax=Polyodon spathula TaxID=7913 RepID=UPI001B7F58B4|nr:CCN family member 2-like [Polyodon spathula]